jgi:hypothetical protein
MPTIDTHTIWAQTSQHSLAKESVLDYSEHTACSKSLWSQVILAIQGPLILMLCLFIAAYVVSIAIGCGKDLIQPLLDVYEEVKRLRTEERERKEAELRETQKMLQSLKDTYEDTKRQSALAKEHLEAKLWDAMCEVHGQEGDVTEDTTHSESLGAKIDETWETFNKYASCNKEIEALKQKLFEIQIDKKLWNQDMLAILLDMSCKAVMVETTGTQTQGITRV